MQKKEFYSIKFDGKPPKEVQIGTINKISGLPDAGAQRATQTVGERGIPNHSTAWGILKRATAGARELTGEIEFLPWGDPKGQLIHLRYHPSCHSISKEYQDFKKLVLPLDFGDLTMKVGINKFDIATDSVLIEMIKHHGYNRSNKSRNPAYKITRFEDYTPVESSKLTATDIELRQKAEKILLDARHNEADLEVLAKLFEIPALEMDQDIFNILVRYTANYKNFFHVLTEKAKEFKAVLTRAAEVKLISLDVVGNVAIYRDGTRELLFEGMEIPGEKADERLEYITDNITSAQIYYPLMELVNEFAQYEQLQLQ